MSSKTFWLSIINDTLHMPSLSGFLLRKAWAFVEFIHTNELN